GIAIGSIGDISVGPPVGGLKCIGKCTTSQACGLDCVKKGYNKGGLCAGLELPEYTLCCCRR
ncbi:hypothetical protein L195_g053229, partial [Trifolium pratense]